MTTSPFSFHCLVCYEQFNADTRYPIIFPCGHTYVCNLCADRLDRCYECRTPLSITLPRPNGDAQATPRAVGPAYNRRQGFQSIHNRNGPIVNKQPPPIKRRLPLPKNVVLLSLMEATELAARDVNSAEQQGPEGDPSTPTIMSSKSLLDPEEEEEEKIKVGTKLAASDCGTYAVADRDGLEIYPIFPSSLASSSFHEESQEDVSSLVRGFHLDNLVEAASTCTDENSETGSNEQQPPPRLQYGDRVQIVSLDNGWAKLARGYGFVRADNNRLVKVSGSVDRACKLEALLRRLSHKRKELKADQMRVDNQFIALMNDLQVSLKRDEDLTVITGDTFHHKPQLKAGDDEDQSETEGRDNTSSPQPAPTELRTTSSTDNTLVKPSQQTDLHRRVPSNTGYFCAGTDVFDSMIPACSEDETHSLENSSLNSAPGRTIQENASMESRALPPITSAQHPSPNSLRAGARAWRELHGRPASSGIDFRTGMSGHTALLSSSANAHAYLESPSSTRNVFRGMSNHSGLTMSKAARRLLYHPLGLGMPSFGGSGSVSREESTIAQTSSIASTS